MWYSDELLTKQSAASVRRFAMWLKSERRPISY
ncbi:hypothetical protein XAB3213_980028 [Xanthomonas citri pv. bilvae]|nr:hypothetical protein XAB3213_980028 [Xanthomonas citri pv. bilvae]